MYHVYLYNDQNGVTEPAFILLTGYFKSCQHTHLL